MITPEQANAVRAHVEKSEAIRWLRLCLGARVDLIRRKP